MRGLPDEGLRDNAGLDRTTKRMVAFLGVAAVIAFAGWRWHETHLPTPYVPSSWINVDRADGAVTFVQWAMAGRRIEGEYVWDGNTANRCVIAPLNGSINGTNLTLTVTYLDGSGSTQWWGSVDTRRLLIGPGDPQAMKTPFVPARASSLGDAISAMGLPACKLSSAG